MIFVLLLLYDRLRISCKQQADPSKRYGKSYREHLANRPASGDVTLSTPVPGHRAWKLVPGLYGE